MINVFEPEVSIKHYRQIYKTLRNKELSGSSQIVQEFEQNIANYFNREFCISTSNGSNSLDLALNCFDFDKHDEVIIPSFTIISCLAAVVRSGATPVFCDVDIDTWNMTLENLKSAVTKKTKAVIAVNLYGNSCNFEALKQVCEEHSLYLIEDNAEAIGTTYKDRLVGTFGDVSCFSFYGNKTITTGEGGMVCTNNPDIAKKIRLYKGQGFVKNSLEYYTHSVVGYNYRMTNLAAAIGYAQINSIEEIIKKKKFIGNFYTSKLSTIDNISLQKVNSDVSSTYWLFNIICKNKTERNELALYLFENNIDSRPLFVPLNELGIYKKQKGKTPKSKKISNLVLSLPSYPELNSEDLTYITEKIYSFYLQLNKKNISNS